jgi:hypothetical protein
LDRNIRLLLSHPERHFAHDETCRFDMEDLRLMTNLGNSKRVMPPIAGKK